MMSPWRDPIYTKRVWFIYELFIAHEEGCILNMIMPPREKKRMVEALTSSRGYGGLDFL